MSNVLEFNAQQLQKPTGNPVYRLKVNGIANGHRVILWQDHYQRLVLAVSQSGQVNFCMEPVSRAG